MTLPVTTDIGNQEGHLLDGQIGGRTHRGERGIGGATEFRIVAQHRRQLGARHFALVGYLVHTRSDGVGDLHLKEDRGGVDTARGMIWARMRYVSEYEMVPWRMGGYYSARANALAHERVEPSTLLAWRSHSGTELSSEAGRLGSHSQDRRTAFL